jgi:hypothetical protein
VKYPDYFRSVLKSAFLQISVFVFCAAALGILALPVNAQNRYSLKITNNSKYPIQKLFVSSTEDNEWGPDQLGEGKNDVLDPGEVFTLTDLVPGEYNIKFVDPDGDPCVLKDIKIFKNESWSLTSAWLEKCGARSEGKDDTPSKAQHRYTLKITNSSSYGIYKLFVMSTEDNKWGPDQLGEGKNDVIHPGDDFTLTDLVPGEYNIRFVNKEGGTCTLKNIKIMKNESWLLTTPWLERCQ